MHEPDRIVRRLQDLHGLSQSTIAAATGASDRSVRNWSGGIEPRPSFRRRLQALEALARTIDKAECEGVLTDPDPETGRCLINLINEDQFDEALALASEHSRGSTTEPVRVSTGPTVLTRGRRHELPFASLSWDEFERFCKQLLEFEHPTARVHHYGTSGSRQRGIDIVVDRDDGTRDTYQCKLVKRCDAAVVRAAVRAHDVEAARNYLLVGTRAQTGARDEIARHPGWDLLDDLDLADRVHRLPLWAARKLLDSFFGPTVRREFLGNAGVGTFLPGDDVLASQLQDNRKYHHRHALVGRTPVLNRLTASTNPIEWRAILVPGRGGIGKTRLLLEFERQVHRLDPHRTVLWLTTESPLSTDVLDELPPEPVILIVDDAHRALNVADLASLVLRRPWTTTLVLALRPQGARPLKAQLAVAGWEPAWIDELPELEPLDAGEAVEVVAASPPLSDRDAEMLTRVADGVPLLLTLGAEVLSANASDPRWLLTDDAFRSVILGSWKDEMLGRVGEAEPSLVRELLSVLSALGPISDANRSLMDRIGSFIGGGHRMIELLASLEEAGILARYGSLLRVVPDVLADELFAGAAVTSVGRDTGFVRRLYDQFGDIGLAPLLRSTAELDWRLEIAGSNVDLVGEVWGLLTDEVHAAAAGGRLALLGRMADAAIYQPRRVLDLVRWVLDNPAVPESRGEHLMPATQDDVREAVAKLLRQVTFRLDHLAEALDLLWFLAQSDARPTNQFPDHPRRVLEDVASYDLGKPVAVQMTVIDRVESWLEAARANTTMTVSPLAILQPLLAKSGYSMRSRGFTVSFDPFFLDAGATRAVRERTLHIALTQMDTTDIRIAGDAVGLIETALREPVGYFGAQPSPEVTVQWRSEQIGILEQVADRASECPAALVPRLRQAVWWQARHGVHDTVRAAAQRVIEQLPDTPDTRLAFALAGGWPHEFDEEGEEDGGESSRARWDRRRRQADERLTVVANELLLGRTAPEVIEHLAEAVTASREVSDRVGSADGVLRAIVRQDPVHGPEILRIAAADGSVLASEMSGAIALCWHADRNATLGLAKEILDRNTDDDLRSLATAWCYAPWDPGATVDEDALGVLVTLLKSDVPGVAETAVRALDPLWDIDCSRATDLLVATSGRNSPSVTDELCSILLNPPDRLASLAESDLRQLLSLLGNVDSLDHHWIRECLKAIGSQHPLLVVQLLLDRIERSQVEPRSGSSGDFRPPLPYDFDAPGQLGAVASEGALADALRLIRDRAVVGGGLDGFWLPILFAGVCDDWGPVTRSVLDEFIAAADPNLITCASSLLRQAPNEFVFTNQAWVTRLLDTAALLGGEALGRVRGDLSASVISGGGSRTPGEPDPRMVRIQESAREASSQSTSPYARRFYEDLIMMAERSIEDDLRRDAEVLGWEASRR